jgi:site-specific DNA recombinase
LVRLSFEPDHGKPERQQERPYLSGTDINGREDQEDRAKRSIEARGGRWVFTYDEPDTSAWKRKEVRVVAEAGNVDYVYRVIRPVYEGALEDLKRGIAPNGESPLGGFATSTKPSLWLAYRSVGAAPSAREWSDAGVRR